MQRTRRRALIGLVTAIALALSGCSGDDEPADTTDTTAGETAEEEPAPQDDGDEPADDESADDEAAEDEAADDEEQSDAPAGTTVATTTSDLGDILVDGEGRTLYMFVPDEGGEPTCTDDCAAVWPVVEGPATAGDGADAALLATATHPSGTTQATYGGWPLYYFANDAAPGDVNGQGVNDVWFVLGPDGEPVRDDVAASGGDVGY